jgi:seryl-tRNA synthetase
VLDLRLIRRDPDAVREALARRGGDVAARLDQVLERDARWREATQRAEALRAEQKGLSEQVAAAKRAGEDASAVLERLRGLSAEVKALTERARAADDELQRALLALPNLPDPTAADADAVVREVGEAVAPVPEPKDHLELAGARIDMERAARLSGARFAYLRGDLVLLELALTHWAMERLGERGFEPVIPPVLVREEALYGTGFLPDTEQQLYALPQDELFLVGTSEVALASLHAGEILDDADLPRRYAGFSPCFRREAGAAGRDTRGIFRVHQFEKVEMFSFVEPSASAEEHERLLAVEEGLLQELGLPYRVVNIAVDDLGPSAAKKYDCEVWLPSQDRYREVTSCSNTTDFQARRLEVRHRAAGAKRPEVLHTLNGTAVAMQRWMIALLEHGQREDGSVALPECLVRWGAPPVLPPAGA